MMISFTANSGGQRSQCGPAEIIDHRGRFMQLIVTEITIMSQGYCVAGWDAENQRMIRPLPDGNNWKSRLIDDLNIAPGVTIGVRPIDQPHNGDYPHTTEDTRIYSTNIEIINDVAIDWFDNKAPRACQTVNEAFANQLQYSNIWNRAKKGVYVQKGTQIGSLNAIRLPASRITLMEDVSFGEKKLRAKINDGQAAYDLKVVAKDLQEAYNLEGIRRIKRWVPSNGDIHVRLGLAREWTDKYPGKCFLMVNGIYG